MRRKPDGPAAVTAFRAARILPEGIARGAGTPSDDERRERHRHASPARIAMAERLRRWSSGLALKTVGGRAAHITPLHRGGQARMLLWLGV